MYIQYRERERYPIFSGTKSPIFPWDDLPKPRPPERPEECVGVTVHTYVTWPSCLRFFCAYMIIYVILYMYCIFLYCIDIFILYIYVCIVYIYICIIFFHTDICRKCGWIYLFMYQHFDLCTDVFRSVGS